MAFTDSRYFMSDTPAWGQRGEQLNPVAKTEEFRRRQHGKRGFTGKNPHRKPKVTQ